MRRWLREPLLHFVLLGALLFALYAWLNPGREAPNEIVVDDSRARLIVAEFQRAWQRPPTAQEFQGLVDTWVREEILFQAGMAQGLDRGDPVVRRRVLQKMEFVADSFAGDAPSDVELQAWLDAHADDYRVDARYSLQQVFFDPLKRDAGELDAALAAARTRLQRNAAAAALGDPIGLRATFVDVPVAELTRAFGRDFTRQIADAPDSVWHGPVRSGHGVHLVRVSARQAERPAQLAEVRVQVERDLTHSKNRSALERFYETAREGYAVKLSFEPKTLPISAGAQAMPR